MRIKKLQVKNFRSIEDSGEQSITKLFALIGKNNCGKSALIDAIQVFWGNKALKVSDFHMGKKQPIEIILTLRDYGDSEAIKKYQDTNGDINVTFRADESSLKGEHQIKGAKAKPADIKALLPDLLVIPAIRNPENETTAGAKSYLKVLMGSLLDLKASSSSPALDEIKDIPAKDLNIDQINALLEHKTKNQIAQISSKASFYFQEAIMSDGMSLEVDPDGDLAKAVSFTTNIIDSNLDRTLSKVNILTCGTGLQSMAILSLLQAYADMEKQQDAIMLIEEPEVYLHPELQRKMFGAIRRIAKDTQVIYTTHSPIMISDLWADDSVRLVKRENGKTVFHPVNIDEVIKELGIRYEDVLNPKAIIFVEGETDAAFFQKIVESINPELINSHKIKFISTESYQSIQVFALMKILYSDIVTSNFYLIADGDAQEGRAESLYQKIIAKVPKAASDEKIKLKERIKILSVHELENYFLDFDFISNLDSSITQDSFARFLELYNQKYAEVYAVYQRTKTSEDRKKVQENYRPSLLFERFKHETRAKKFFAAYGDDSNFIEVKNKITDAMNKLFMTGKCPISTMLDGININEKVLLREPLDLIRGIISALDEDKISLCSQA